MIGGSKKHLKTHLSFTANEVRAWYFPGERGPQTGRRLIFAGREMRNQERLPPCPAMLVEGVMKQCVSHAPKGGSCGLPQQHFSWAILTVWLLYLFPRPALTTANWLSYNRNVPSIPEAGNWKSRCQQGHAFSDPRRGSCLPCSLFCCLQAILGS